MRGGKRLENIAVIIADTNLSKNSIQIRRDSYSDLKRYFQSDYSCKFEFDVGADVKLFQAQESKLESCSNCKEETPDTHNAVQRPTE